MHTISFECAVKIDTTYKETATACARVGTTGVLFPRLGNHLKLLLTSTVSTQVQKTRFEKLFLIYIVHHNFV